jgi:hypothetical protein
MHLSLELQFLASGTLSGFTNLPYLSLEKTLKALKEHQNFFWERYLTPRQDPICLCRILDVPKAAFW